MKNTNLFLGRLAVAMTLLAVSLAADAAEVVYRIVEYNKSTAEFALAASGRVPKGSWAYFQNDYGATTGNRYNQIPRNQKAVLYLEGWQGCKLKSVTLSMCSNSKSGQAGLTVSDGDTQLYRLRPADFADDTWFGDWVPKDLNVYVDITKPLDVPALTSSEASITLQGGTSEGSVYLDAVTIEYDEVPGTVLESPLGWSYEKLSKKSTLRAGDEVMIYRNGCAAADYDGMQTSHYLDAVALASTADVASPDVLRFTLDKADDQDLWTLTDQYGRRLGATGKQSLAWDEGNTQWAIELGYEGATVTNGNAGYGTLRYNAPEGSYARFNVYTSGSLPLPFLYRKDRQNEPVQSRSLTFGETDMEVYLESGHVALTPTMLPASTTDRRIIWSSSNEDVATVNGGYVTLLGTGQTVVTAKAQDGGAEACVSLTVSHATGIAPVLSAVKRRGAHKVLENRRLVIKTPDRQYSIGGVAR